MTTDMTPLPRWTRQPFTTGIPAVDTPTIPRVRTADYRLSAQPRIHIDPDWLRDAYVVQGRSCADIGGDVGANPNTIDRRLHALGIPVCTRAR
jgi:hypothetical protein